MMLVQIHGQPQNLVSPGGTISAAAAGNKVLFAGGFSGFFQYSTRVDIYDVSTSTWSTSSLNGRTPTGTVGMTATSIGNKIYFSGEGSDWFAWDFGSILQRSTFIMFLIIPGQFLT